MNKSLCFIALFLTSIVWGQSKSKPKLVVGIVVDQMVVDYLYRFDSRYSKGGLMLMRDKGTNVRNAQYNYIPTYTGSGHASIYTGTTPNSHGIVANDWYDRSTQEEVGCVNDSNYFSVGSESNYGLKSPKNLKCMTITDQMKMTRPNAKVISVSLKDQWSNFTRRSFVEWKLLVRLHVRSLYYERILCKRIAEMGKKVQQQRLSDRNDEGNLVNTVSN